MIDQKYINDYLSSLELDVRNRKDGTWIDQKCAYDVVAYVADCILAYYYANEENEPEPLFTIKTIWNQDYSKDNIVIFGKRAVEIRDREYDKFFGQPIKLLCYAGVITVNSIIRNQYFFQINNIDLLEYIASGGIKTLTFLQTYIEAVLKASGIYSSFENYWERQDLDSYLRTKTAFTELMINYAPKGSRGGDPAVECGRIFNKVINPLAFKYKKKGSIQGRPSKDIIQMSDMVYNRKNFRDISSGKPKNVSRKAHIKALSLQEINDAVENYEVAKATKALRRYNKKNNSGFSECIPDCASNINGIDVQIEIYESKNKATQIHHIFPQKDFKSISAHLENLIALSPNQHSLYAHPDNKTQEINRDYQCYLLLSKIERIRNSDDEFYSFDRLKDVLNTGFSTEEFSDFTDSDYDAIINLVKSKY